ncbi:MAG: sodium-dependent transporter, partial [Cyclobacteriaceae bacterium]
LMMFPLVAYNLGGNMENVQGGAGLIFVTLPGVFESLGPVLGAFIGGFFFLLLSFAALTSTVSLLEVPVSYAVDEYKVPRKAAVGVMAVIIFLAGIPSLVANGDSNFFSNQINLPNRSDFMSMIGYVTDTLLMFGGFCIVVFAAYVWKKENLEEEISEGYPGYKSSFIRKFLNFSITYLCPALLFFLFVMVVMSNFFGISII